MKSKQRFDVKLLEFLLTVPSVTDKDLCCLSLLTKKDKKKVLGKYWFATELFPFLHMILKSAFYHKERCVQLSISYNEFASLLLAPEGKSTSLDIRITPFLDFVYHNMITTKLLQTEELFGYWINLKLETVKTLHLYIGLCMKYRELGYFTTLQNLVQVV